MSSLSSSSCIIAAFLWVRPGVSIVGCLALLRLDKRECRKEDTHVKISLELLS